MSEADCKTNKDYWLYILTHLETMNTTVPFQAQKPIFHKLENIADMAQLTREEREHYHISLDSFRTNLAVMEHERNEGRNEGRVEGRAEGRVEERLEIIQTMMSKGMSIRAISDLLDIPEKDIEELI